MVAQIFGDEAAGIEYRPLSLGGLPIGPRGGRGARVFRVGRRRGHRGQLERVRVLARQLVHAQRRHGDGHRAGGLAKHPMMQRCV